MLFSCCYNELDYFELHYDKHPTHRPSDKTFRYHDINAKHAPWDQQRRPQPQRSFACDKPTGVFVDTFPRLKATPKGEPARPTHPPQQASRKED